MRDLAWGGVGGQCPGMPGRSRQWELRPRYGVEYEKVGKPREFLEARQAGKGGVGGHFKGTSGNSRAVRALCTADSPGPNPRIDPVCFVAGPQTKAASGLPSPTWTLGFCGTGCAHESLLAPRDSLPPTPPPEAPALPVGW